MNTFSKGMNHNLKNYYSLRQMLEVVKLDRSMENDCKIRYFQLPFSNRLHDCSVAYNVLVLLLQNDTDVMLKNIYEIDE